MVKLASVASDLAMVKRPVHPARTPPFDSPPLAHPHNDEENDESGEESEDEE
jgi:hypothetical protein